MNIYLMRHGQSSANAKNLINCDSSKAVVLTELGKKQVADARKKLGEMKFNVVYTSEFLRTQQTASLVVSGNLHFEEDKRINEFNYGMEGSNAEEYYKLRKESGQKEFEFKLEGAESLKELKDRVSDFVEDLKNSGAKDVLIVTHETVVASVLAIFGKIPDSDIANFKVKNAEYFRLEM